MIPEELTRHCLLRNRRAGEIRIEPLQQTRTQPACGLCRPESSYFALPEQVVAREGFISAFARENDFDAVLSHEARQKKERGWCSPQNRAFGVIDDIRKNVCNVF